MMRVSHAGRLAVASVALTALGGCTIYRDCPVVYEPSAVVVAQEPPKVWERVDEVPAKPSADAVWVDGYYDWDGTASAWVWIDGHWETGRSGQAWTPPNAVRTQGGYEYHPGYWRPADAEPSGVYRRESDVRVSARARASASIRFGTGGGSGATATDDRRQQDGGVRVREGERPTTTGSGTRPTTGATSGGTTTTNAPATTGTASGATNAPVRSGTRGTAPASSGVAPGSGSTAPASGGGTTVVTANNAGVRGDGAPVVQDEPPVATGPIGCVLDNRVTVRNGLIEATLENVVSRPSFLATEPLPVTARQGEGYDWRHVRLRVPLDPGSYQVQVSTADGRRAECGFLQVIGN